jgi:hypothetical protein
MKKTYKYQVVSEEKQPQGHMLYFLRYKADNGAKSEYWVGQTRLRRFYEQGRLTDKLSDHLKAVVTAKPAKPVPKTKMKLEPRMEGDGPVYSKPKWNLKDFEIVREPQPINEHNHPATGRAYLISREDGRYCVVLPDGNLDDDWTPLNMAQDYMNIVNKEAGHAN